MGFTPSKYQVNIYDVFENTQDNIVVNAVAGSGKSSTLLQLLKRTKRRVEFLAFNKAIQLEIAQKTKTIHNVNVSTIHSLGVRSIFNYFGNVEIKSNKAWILSNKLNKNKWKLNQTTYVKSMNKVHRITDIFRLTLCEDFEKCKKICDDLGVDWDTQSMEMAQELYQEYCIHNQTPSMIDFTDMIHIPATNDNISIQSKASILFIDECQDLNACQHKLIDKLIKQNNARFVACGDPYQSIYNFAGADSRSFQLFTKKPNVKSMPLSICYRCPTRVVDKANQVYNIIEPFQQNPPGVVRLGSSNEIQENDMVICRNVKPLVPLYFELISRGIKAKIKGSDIGAGLVKLLPKTNSNTKKLIIDLGSKLNHKLVELEQNGITQPKKHPAYDKLQDKVDLLKFLCEKFKTTNQIKQFLQKVFSDSKQQGVVLCTIHKSKGLEANNVFILDKKLIPSKFAKSQDQIQQENNLLYVAITRAQKKLIYINSLTRKTI